MIASQNFKLQDGCTVEMLGEIPQALVLLEQSLEFGRLLVFTKLGYCTAALAFLKQIQKYGDCHLFFANLEDTVCNFSAILIMPNKIVLARDLMGSIPLFYAQTKQGFVISISLEKLRHHLNINAISREYLEIFLAANYASSPQWEITPWQGIFRVQPNHICTLQYKKVHTEQFAVVPTIQVYPNIDLIGAQLENELVKALPDTEKSGILLSGGFDSSLLLSLANRKSKELYALHHIARIGDKNEDTYFAELAVQFVSGHIRMDTLPISNYWDYKNWKNYASTYEEPNVGIAGGELETYRALQLKSVGIGNLISGIGGDAFREDLAFLGDFYRNRNYFSLLYQLWRLSEFIQIDRSDWELEQNYDQNNLKKATYLQLSQKVQEITQIGWLNQKKPKARSSVYKQLLYGHAAFSLEQSVLWKYGISQYYPFLTRKSLALALAIPPEKHIDKNLGTRAFFKRCFAHCYHPEMLRRNSKDSWGVYHSVGLAQEFHGLQQLFEKSQLALYGLLNPQAFIDILYNRLQHGETLNFIEARVVALEIWLQTRT